MSELDDPLFVEYMQSDNVAMAIASDIAYKHELHTLDNPATANVETQKLLNERFTEPHFLMPEFSSNNAITIKRPNNEYIMAVRGTRPSNISDLVSDTQILLNEPKINRTENVKQLYKSFRAEQPNSKLTLTGDSLGAYVAHKIANEYDETFVGFNLPASPLGILSDNLDYNTTAEHTIYLTKNLDVISSLNKYTKFNDKIITLPQKQSTQGNLFGSHSIENFLPNRMVKHSQSKLRPRILKTKRGKNTFFSVNPEAVRRSANASVAIDEFANCYSGNRFEKCTKINKKM